MYLVSLPTVCWMLSTAFGVVPLSAFVPHALPTRSGSASSLLSVPSLLDTVTSGLASICRLPYGVTVVTSDLLYNDETTTTRLVVLYDMETSRACRAVRERISELDLVVEAVVPAAPNGRVFVDEDYKYHLPREESDLPRLVVVEASGDRRALVGEDAILEYLNASFCSVAVASIDEEDAKAQVVNALTNFGGYVALLLRLGRGSTVAAAAASDSKRLVPRPDEPLILYSYEGNQFCRLVREVLTELDIVYELRSAGKESPRRAELAAITGGSSQCPFLIDPNTNVQMPESAEIIRYLYKTYALWTPPNELLQFASNFVLPVFRPVFSALAPVQAGSLKEDKSEFETELSIALADIEEEINQAPVVVYTYKLSPFSSETKSLLENLDIAYTEISLGLEWVPGLIAEGGSAKRAALLRLTGQSSLPHIFIGGTSIGGIFSGTPGLVPALEQGILTDMVAEARSARKTVPPSVDTDSVERLGEFE